MIAPVAKPARVRIVRRADGRLEVRCGGCGYGAVVMHLPKRCPMCGGAEWQSQ